MAFEVKWQPWMDEVLKDRFANTRNAELALEFGVCEVTVTRHARSLGLKKSPEYLEEISREGLRVVEYKRLTEGRCGGFEKGTHKGTSGSFKKGFRFKGEIEEKRVKAIRDRAWDERVRIIRGMKRKTKWKMLDF